MPERAVGGRLQGWAPASASGAAGCWCPPPPVTSAWAVRSGARRSRAGCIAGTRWRRARRGDSFSRGESAASRGPLLQGLRRIRAEIKSSADRGRARRRDRLPVLRRGQVARVRAERRPEAAGPRDAREWRCRASWPMSPTLTAGVTPVVTVMGKTPATRLRRRDEVVAVDLNATMGRRAEGGRKRCRPLPHR